MIPDILDIIDKTITKYVLDNKLSFENCVQIINMIY